ncbi:hypothetical protein C8250_005195 [Streptomyces sp. So13.3]|uniref:alkaline phosphatase PhoX n=1 Tax=Streptomyces TaxID=1883 RepID=UPI0011068BFA|nr:MULTISPECIES: alkaline phosphatase PhoX [Streptomyces]MCZ4094987.1 hypothetical protein [Streptomyces sp. H39-C1]QNA71382.1 hypothetical protein C8250_005195 [Streptomyces sp. So13.3]
MKRHLTALAAAMVALTAGAGAIFAGSVPDRAEAAGRGNPHGVTGDLAHSSNRAISKAEALAHPERLVTLAKSLHTRVVNARLPLTTDQGALWPSDSDPRWLISCNESDPDKPGLLRTELATGRSQTILTGTEACDPVRRTAWGTIVIGEETGGGPEGGRLYELIDPLHTTGVTLDRSTGRFSGGTGAANLTVRPGVGRMSYEGISVLPNGLLYYADENRPDKGAPGGALFKFVPDKPRAAGVGPIHRLSESPFASGRVYGLRLGRYEGGRDYGQGTQTGQGAWIPVPDRTDPDLTGATAALHLTGLYRPEDMDLDGTALAAGQVRACVNETGNEDEAQNWGESVCLTDGTVAAATTNAAIPQIQLFVPGSPAVNMPDNLAFRPGRGTWVVHEDGDTESDLQGFHGNDLWSCLPDGSDPDLQSDGCIRVATVNDPMGSFTGGVFDATGRHLYVIVQYNVTGYGVLLDISGWK